jgi:hypothetical protein
MPSAWFTGSTPSRIKTAPPRQACAPPSGSSTAISRRAPTAQRKADLEAAFDRIFTGKTGFVTFDRLLARLHANKAELLKVLEGPEIPLHTNGSENDIRCHVSSDRGRDARDTFLALAKTCTKLGISYWNSSAHGSTFEVPPSRRFPA